MADPGLSGDEFTEAFARHGRTLWLLAAAWVGREDAMDLVQETARVAWERRGSFVRGTDVRAWLSQIARHLGSNARRRRRPVAVDPADLQPEAPLPPAGLEFGDELHRALRGLPEVQRACLLLHVVGEHTFGEIGAMLELPVNTAASHARRARLALQKTMTPTPRTP